MTAMGRINRMMAAACLLMAVACFVAAFTEGSALLLSAGIFNAFVAWLNWSVAR